MYEENQFPNEIKQKYVLSQITRKFKKKSLISFFYQPIFKTEKKFKPITYQGYRRRLNLETGEIEFYNTALSLCSLKCSIRRTRILLASLLEMNTFDWFLTFTFDKLKIDRSNESLVYETFKKFLKNTKDRLPRLGYVVVPEKHNDGCIHFHMLLQMNGYTPFDLDFSNSGKVCCSWATKKNGIASKEFFEKTKSEHELKITDGLPIYNVGRFNYGFTTASKIANKEACNAYIKKYVSKDFGMSTDFFKKRFYYSHNLVQPEIVRTTIGAELDYTPSLEQKKLTNPTIRKYELSKKYNNDIYSYFNEEYNNLQYWVPAEKATSIENVPDDAILVDIESPFDIEQLKIN